MQLICTILLAIWQLPQTLLGLAVIACMAGRTRYVGDGVWTVRGWTSGVCLGEFIALCTWFDSTDLRHERGHREQSRILGPLYLLVVGLPSVIGNLIDRRGHRSWPDALRSKWYYDLPWEADADQRGGVKRWNV